MNIEEQIIPYQKLAKSHNAQLVAVSKTKPITAIEAAYETGQRIFGENKVQELVEKHEILPKDIKWHMIGHLQTNKVKYIAPFIDLIHAIDSLKLLKEINKQALKNNRVIDCLLQIHISTEDSKFGFSYEELNDCFISLAFNEFENIKIIGLMGMATNTKDTSKIRSEFNTLNAFFINQQKTSYHNIDLKQLSMGMSSDYKIALEEGSSLIRIGSAIFGTRAVNTLL
jgi:pyridoxal phosphate enzyme (YggS family)